jgi:hypothetical protein
LFCIEEPEVSVTCETLVPIEGFCLSDGRNGVKCRYPGGSVVTTGATGTEGATVGGTVGAIVGAMVGAMVGGTVVGGVVVEPTFNPCWGSVVTVVPSAITNVVVSGSRSPVVVTPVMVAVHTPGALKFIPW